ncbi:MAG TPA: anaerobic ribonucleoside-triphosphate reductase activating protein [Methanoregulaceae archaeon]|nr:anaerobic ribonucleoside-triphosphate reductase activating protein [Methanoregulaceae archaeon]HQJ87304.1 anaerobic ribonucleoside-triphosphate reductase activating protein [Methanoregulaceae archaeon]
MPINFGGFVSVSTVDWPGRAVCTVFFRGCPVRCFYCQNASLLSGSDMRDEEEIAGMIAASALVVSGVVFSGGEPTMQGDALAYLARESHRMGLVVGVQTNGVYPRVLARLIDEGLVDRVALDIKARWERYARLFGVDLTGQVKESLALCRRAYLEGRLPEFEVVVTLFRGYEDEVASIARETAGVPLVLQQGVHGEIKPLSFGELAAIAAGLGRPCRIRTRESGEQVYEADRSGGTAGKR